MPLEEYGDASEENIAAFRILLEPLRQTLSSERFLGGYSPAYADYAVFGTCKFAELVSPQVLFAADDPIEGWRQRMHGMFDGMAASNGSAIEAN